MMLISTIKEGELVNHVITSPTEPKTSFKMKYVVQRCLPPRIWICSTLGRQTSFGSPSIAFRGICLLILSSKMGLRGPGTGRANQSLMKDTVGGSVFSSGRCFSLISSAYITGPWFWTNMHCQLLSRIPPSSDHKYEKQQVPLTRI